MSDPKKPAFATKWPVQEVRARDLYFYNEPLRTAADGVTVGGDSTPPLVSFASYSYLALNRHPRIDRAANLATEQFGTGTHGVRLLSGTVSAHKELEAAIASFAGTEAALCFSSGYMANVSTIASLVGPRDAVIADRLAHASLVDGARLSKAEFIQFRHNDPVDLETCLRAVKGRTRLLVLVDAVYSMDGDICELPGILEVCQQYGALLLVDEAHALGVIGKRGRGIEEHFGMNGNAVHIKTGTLGKTIPSVGGYATGSREFCDFLAFEASGFIYSGSLPAAAAAAAKEALGVIQDEPERIEQLWQNAQHLAAGLRRLRIPFQDSPTAIFPIICGEDLAALEMAAFCRERGIFVQAIPYPVVPRGRARLRVCVTAAHRPEHLRLLVTVLGEAFDAMGLPRSA